MGPSFPRNPICADSSGFHNQYICPEEVLCCPDTSSVCPCCWDHLRGAKRDGIAHCQPQAPCVSRFELTGSDSIRRLDTRLISTLMFTLAFRPAVFCPHVSLAWYCDWQSSGHHLGSAAFLLETCVLARFQSLAVALSIDPSTVHTLYALSLPPLLAACGADCEHAMCLSRLPRPPIAL